MNQDFKLLSICIPTYNGSKYIRKNLDEIVNQIISYKLNYIEVATLLRYIALCIYVSNLFL